MQNKAFLADVGFFSPYTRVSTDKESMNTGYRDIGYAEGDLLFDIIKEGLMAKPIAADALPPMAIVDMIQYFNIQNPTMQQLIKEVGAVAGPYANEWRN